MKAFLGDSGVDVFNSQLFKGIWAAIQLKEFDKTVFKAQWPNHRWVIRQVCVVHAGLTVHPVTSAWIMLVGIGLQLDVLFR